MEQKHLDYILSHFYTVYAVPETIKADLATGKSKVNWPDVAGDFFEGKSNNPPSKVYKVLEKPIPFLFPEGEELQHEKAGIISLGFDFTAACFFFLSGFQDWHALKKSSRFRSRDAAQYRLQTHRIPLVNYYFVVLKEALEKTHKTKIEPVGKYPLLFLSHDVDNLTSGWLEGGFAEAKAFRFHNTIALIAKRIFGRDDWYNLDRIMAMEEGLGVHSTFFMLARKEKENADYDITKPKYHKWINLLQGRCFEVGIHGSKGTHESAKRLGADLRRIKHRVFGNRFHYLYFRPQSSYRALEKNKLKYDSSLGFFDEVGFRNAYCFPFRLWHFNEDRPVEFVELPLIVMDTTLAKQKYLYIRPDDAIITIYDLLKEVGQFNGMMSLLWHNNYFSDYKYNGWRNVYAESVKNALKMGYKSKTGYLIWEEFTKNRGL
jgi:peptidoglycan/xylan/chitin deacetylase (PgdA/CDA1 family)